MTYVFISKVEPYVRCYDSVIKISVTVSSVFIFCVGTVNHPNISYDAIELKKSKRLARSLLVIELLLLVFMEMIQAERVYISYSSIGIILCAILILLSKVFRQEVKIWKRKRE